MKLVFIILLLLLTGSVSAYMYFQPSSYLTSHPATPTQPLQTATICEALHVVTPKTNTTVSSPLEVEVIIDNSQKNCRWIVFEAQAGDMKLIDEKGTILGEGILRTTDNWMTESPVRYSGKITFSKTAQNQKATLVITEENPSGEGKPQTINIPLTL